jgi:pSer/pThr/pTyr-binding forkhead associated (FHA) protein
MDPRLHSIHLDAPPRREAFRQARARLQNAVGIHTLAGDLRAEVKPPDLEMATMAKGQEPVVGRPDSPVAWILDRSKALPLFIGMNSIGRLPDNNLVIEDACVSRRHCAIVVHSDMTCELHDIASKNGTCVNGRKLQGPLRLEEGDELCLSDHRLTFTRQLLNGTAQGAKKNVPVNFEDHTLAG